MNVLSSFCNVIAVLIVTLSLLIVSAHATPEIPPPLTRPSGLGGQGGAPTVDQDGGTTTPTVGFSLRANFGNSSDSTKDTYWKKIELEWDQLLSVQEFAIEQRIGSGGWSEIRRVGQADQDYEFKLPGNAGQRYHYRVVGIKTTGSSGPERYAYTNVVRINPFAELSATSRVRNVKVKNVGFLEFSVNGEEFTGRRFLTKSSTDASSATFSQNVPDFERTKEFYGYSTTDSSSYAPTGEIAFSDDPDAYYLVHSLESSPSKGFRNYSNTTTYLSGVEFSVYDKGKASFGADGTWSGSLEQTDSEGNDYGSRFWSGPESSVPPYYSQYYTTTPFSTKTDSGSTTEGSYSPESIGGVTSSELGLIYSSDSLSDEYTIDQLMGDAITVLNSVEELAYPEWDDALTGFDNLFGSSIFGLEDQHSVYLLREIEYRLELDKKSIRKPYHFRERFDAQYPSGENQRPTYSYRKVSLGETSSLQQIGQPDMLMDFGTYSVYRVIYDLEVADWRGVMGENEEDVSLYDPNVTDPNDPIDPNGASLFFDVDGSSVTVQGRASYGGYYLADSDDPEASYCKMTVSWTNPSLVKVSGNNADGEPRSDLSPPITYRGPGSFSESFTVTVADGVEEENVITFKMDTFDEFGTKAGSDSLNVFLIGDPSDATPGNDGPEVYSIPYSDSTGPRYRKLALNGRPISDEKPQASKEADYAPEETYIDAFNLSLAHSVTDLYTPIPGSELSLGIRRTYNPTIWTMFSGLRPHERSDLPFGGGWTNGGIPYVHIMQPVGSFDDGFREPSRATIYDENGNSHQFMRYEGQDENGQQIAEWVPMPGGKHDAKSHLNTFDGSVFRRKHGTTIKFEATNIEPRTFKDRVGGSESYDDHFYLRAEYVKDRLGYSVNYDYPINANDPTQKTTLIPYKIYAMNSADQPLPNQQIFIRQDNQQRITSVWDSMGNEVKYNYDTDDYPHPNLSNTLQQVHFLTSVVAADGGTTEYTYNDGNKVYIDLNTTPRPGLELPRHHYYVELTQIKDPRDNVYTFDLKIDETKQTYLKNTNIGQDGYVVTEGLPRYVNKVSLPGVETNSIFELMGTETPMYVDYVNGVPALTNSDRKTVVVDTEGAVTTYDFTDMEMVTLTTFKDLYANSEGLSVQQRAELRYKSPRLIYYKTMTITHQSIATETYGSEIFTFNPDAGMALATATDLGGHLTSYLYEDPVDTAGSFEWPGLNRNAFL